MSDVEKSLQEVYSSSLPLVISNDINYYSSSQYTKNNQYRNNFDGRKSGRNNGRNNGIRENDVSMSEEEEREERDRAVSLSPFPRSPSFRFPTPLFISGENTRVNNIDYDNYDDTKKERRKERRNSRENEKENRREKDRENGRENSTPNQS